MSDLGSHGVARDVASREPSKASIPQPASTTLTEEGPGNEEVVKELPLEDKDGPKGNGAPAYTDEEFERLIKETFAKDAIKDAAIDTFLYDLKKAGGDSLQVMGQVQRRFSTEEELLQKLPEKALAAFPRLKLNLVATINSHLIQHGNHQSQGVTQEFNALWSRILRRWSRVWEALADEKKEPRIWAAETKDSPPEIDAGEDPFLTAAANLPTPSLGEASSVWPVQQKKGSRNDLGDGGGTSSPEHAALNRLSAAVRSQRKHSTFACSGSIAISPDHVAGDSATYPPVQIRWGSSDHGAHGYAMFPNPSKNHAGSTESAQFQSLLRACQPATFGRGTENVLDESYRKAAKMIASDFSTNFSPYEAGIIDSVNQILLPSLKDTPSLGTVAELYSLNVYSAPSGRFKPHADTPREENHYASLVVCLPSTHVGGGLAVRHESTEHVFDWTQSAPTKIQWAAFYRDCEHEVFEVLKGHRVTLTYNLYFAPRVGLPIRSQNPSIDASRTELYQLLKQALDDPQFLPFGGVLGIHCSHKYPHVQAAAKHHLPTALKGIDLAMYAALRALGLAVKVAPALGGRDGMSMNARMKGHDDEQAEAEERLQRFQRCGRYEDVKRPESMDNTAESKDEITVPQGDQLQLEYEEVIGDDWCHIDLACPSRKPYRPTGDFEAQRAHMLARRVQGLQPEAAAVRLPVGLQWSDLVLDDYGFDENEGYVLKWPHGHVRHITWLNECVHHQPQLIAIAYGNEPWMDCFDSAVVQLAIVPPIKDGKRAMPEEVGKALSEGQTPLTNARQEQSIKCKG